MARCPDIPVQICERLNIASIEDSSIAFSRLHPSQVILNRPQAHLIRVGLDFKWSVIAHRHAKRFKLEREEIIDDPAQSKPQTDIQQKQEMVLFRLQRLDIGQAYQATLLNLAEKALVTLVVRWAPD